MLMPVRTARRLFAPVIILTTLLLAGAASAAIAPSKNWAGFLIGGSHKHFRSVAAYWREPSPHCNRTHVATSATWVGLGGVFGGGLEQTGTQMFCYHGRTATRAWYELLPAPARFLTLPVRSGDRMAARVTAVGHRVTLAITDLTRGVAFAHTFLAKGVNTTTAEWVEEAPSVCTRSGRCRLVRLANFGSVRFSGARATDRRGHSGAISSHRWKHLRLVLIQERPGYTNIAIPSVLRAGGSVFSIKYRSGA